MSDSFVFPPRTFSAPLELTTRAVWVSSNPYQGKLRRERAGGYFTIPIFPPFVNPSLVFTWYK